jgi:hypothetical protein
LGGKDMGCCDICGASLKGKIIHTVQAHREKTPENIFLVFMCDRCKGVLDDCIERQERKEQFKVVGQ